jgi:pimeloyl-ACP methyl ester carboxylesterase
MDEHDRTARAADGRTLMVAEWGDLAGSPVFALHGTPGCRRNRHPNQELVRSTGAHVVAYDRPGYGGSDRQRHRRIADCAADVAAIADQLGFERFAVWGGSGGGSHALAVAALLGDRVTRVACVVGLAPYEAMGEEWARGMDPENVKEVGWALEGEERLVVELTREAEEMRERVAKDPKTLLEPFDLPESDRAALARPEFAPVIREEVEESTRNGVWGWVDDDLAHVSQWGFDLTAIRVPAAVWYGAEDVLVPPAHGQWLARNVPGAVARIQQRGHLGDPDRNVVELNGWLVEGRPWD